MESNIHNNKDKKVKPILTLVTLLAIMVLLFIVMFSFPEKGISLGNSTLQFPSINDFFLPKIEQDSSSKAKEDLASLFDSTIVVSEIDSTIIKHKLDSLNNFRKSIQIPGVGKSSLHRFFSALDNGHMLAQELLLGKGFGYTRDNGFFSRVKTMLLKKLLSNFFANIYYFQ